LVPVPAPVLAPDPENLAQFSNNNNILQNLAFSMSAAALFFQGNWPLILIF
jgi:hypothetical protein